jgi:hypothetical protein
MFPLRRPEPHAATALPRLWPGLCAQALLLALGLSAGAALAQGPVDGALEGIVFDSSGAPIAGARVTVHDPATGLDRSGEAGASGSFLLAHLPPGVYATAFSAPGFAASPGAAITISLGETRVIWARLRIAPVETAVVVTPVEEASTGPAGMGTTLSGLELQTLPGDAQRWRELALLAPGVMPDQDADGLLSVHGLPSTQNSMVVDGVDHNQSFGSVPAGTGSDPGPDPAEDSDSAEVNTGPSQGLSRSRHAGVSYSFSQSAVREFRITTQNYTALSGGAAGGVVTTVSKSGTNELHGSGFFTLRSQAFAATNPLSLATSYADGIASTETVKPHDLRENFGLTLGGPLGKASGARMRAHPLFYFMAVDVQRRGFPAISSPADPAFYSLTAIQLALLANRGVETAQIAQALSYLSSLTGSTPRRADQDLEFGRVDWKAAARQELGLQYNRVRWNSPAGLIDAPVVARGRASLGNAAGSLDAGVFRATSTLSAHWINQARVQYARDLQYQTPQANLPQEPGIGPGGMAPEVNIGPDGLLFGTPASLSQQAYPDERRIEAGDTLSWQHGRHLLEVGMDVSTVRDIVATLGNATGTFRYDSARTSANAGGLVDFITDYTYNVNAYPNGGCPSINAAKHLFCFTSYSQSFGEQQATFSTREWAGFVEDTWRPRRRLAIHAGARYEYVGLPPAQAPNLALDALFGARGATSVLPEDRNNLGPRLGASWEPFGAGRGVIRAGYGAYFGRLPGATIRNALADTALPVLAGAPNSTTRIRILPSVETDCPQAMGQGFGYPCSFLAQPSGIVAATSSAMVFDRRFRLPTVQQGSFTMERGVGRRATVSASYVINLDRQLATSTDLNIAPSTGLARFQVEGGAGAAGVTPGQEFVVPLYTQRVSTAFGPVTDIVSNVNATYHALVFSAETQNWRGLEGRVSYSWSKAIDYGANLSATPRTNGQFDPFTDGYDKGLSSLNYPQALHLAGVWTSRAGGESRWVHGVLSGWQVAPIVLAHSGRPYSYEMYGGTRLSGGHQSINGSGGALCFPTVGRNTLRLPDSVNADLRISRGFTPGGHLLGEPLKVRLAAEIFNLTNRMNLSSVEERAFLVGTASGGVTPLVFQDAATIAAEGLTTQAFGTPTAASSSLARERQVQLSLRVEF